MLICYIGGIYILNTMCVGDKLLLLLFSKLSAEHCGGLGLPDLHQTLADL